MPVTQITSPTEEPITLQEAKDHLNITFADDDAMIQSLLIPSARQSVESYLRRVLIQQTLEWMSASFPQCVALPYPPLVSVTSVKYVDSDGVEQTLSADKYSVHAEYQPGLVVSAYGETWPAVRDVPNSVKIQYLAGYADASSVPAPIKSAILLLIGHMYENREENIIGQPVESLLFGYKALLSPYRIIEF